jgi:osmotically-inducible protein OsmY
LESAPYFALRDIICASQDGVLTLRGRLPSYYLKQLAQTVVADVEGVTRIVNEIEVMAPLDRAGGSR